MRRRRRLATCGKAPRVPNFDNGRKRVVTFTVQPLYPLAKKLQVPEGKKVGGHGTSRVRRDNPAAVCYTGRLGQLTYNIVQEAADVGSKRRLAFFRSVRIAKSTACAGLSNWRFP